jgi:hypothetical protein
MVKPIPVLVFLTLFGMFTAAAQTYDLQFVEVQNTGTIVDYRLQVRSTGAAFGMGSGNLVFTYSTAVLGTPSILTAHNFSGGLYGPMGLTLPAAGRVSVNIEYNGAAGQGTAVQGTYTDAVTLRFPVTDRTGNPLLRWRTVTPNRTNIFLDDNSTLLTAGTLHNLDEPLAVQLEGFTGSVMDGGAVLLQWTTLSENNNYGFEVERATGDAAGFSTLAHSFVAGHGTSGVAHSYAFVDSSAGQGSWTYRLKQIDLDGTVHHSEGIQVDVTTDVREALVPKEFALGQNYPNPFNPGTAITYAIPRPAHVTLEVFNLLGERIGMLVDDVRQPGYYSARFDGTSIASGIYFYRLTAGEVKLMKRMLLVK